MFHFMMTPNVKACEELVFEIRPVQIVAQLIIKSSLLLMSPNL